ncbi:zinc finger BED domain-containing protein 6-like [Dendrobates tinctorius]|uniref:zinc finger BED domain-containing protein 6-like n=1 Tax=Dendrobates tinctorius TaxID=92724 RepID=UPI003CC9E074
MFTCSHITLRGLAVASEGMCVMREKIKIGHQRKNKQTNFDDGDDYLGEEDASRVSRENVGVARSGTGFVRDWRDVDLPESAPPPSSCTASLTPGTLAHMSHYALQILKRDRRIAKMMNDDDYWLASILDPRYKGKFQNIMPQENLDLILANKQATLVNRLVEAFPAHSSGDGSHTSRRGQGQLGRGVRGAHIRSGVGDRGFMTMLWNDFSSPAHTTGNTASMESDRRQHLSTMVTNYFSSHVDVLPHRSFPFDYWAAKLDTWPELAQYALQELACPAASVLSERVFSAAGSILTEKRTRLSTQNVDDLTFIKMNHAWVSKDFVPPSPDDT